MAANRTPAVDWLRGFWQKHRAYSVLPRAPLVNKYGTRETTWTLQHRSPEKHTLENTRKRPSPKFWMPIDFTMAITWEIESFKTCVTIQKKQNNQPAITSISGYSEVIEFVGKDEIALRNCVAHTSSKTVTTVKKDIWTEETKKPSRNKLQQDKITP